MNEVNVVWYTNQPYFSFFFSFIDLKMVFILWNYWIRHTDLHKQWPLFLIAFLEMFIQNWGAEAHRHDYIIAVTGEMKMSSHLNQLSIAYTYDTSIISILCVIILGLTLLSSHRVHFFLSIFTASSMVCSNCIPLVAGNSIHY